MSSRSISPLPDLVAAVIRLLIERPRSVEDLAEALTGEGLRLGSNPVEYVEDLFDEATELHHVVPFIDEERMFWPAEVLRGAVFTHVVTDPEIAHDLLLATPDLLPLGMVIALDPSPVPMSDGSELRSVMAGLDDELLAQHGAPAGLVGDDAWLLAPGWFGNAGIATGDVVTVEFADGLIRITRADVAFDELRATRVRKLLHGLAMDIDAASAHEIDVLVASAIDADPTAFAEPLPPLSALLPQAGFTVQGDYLCPPGVDLRAQRNAARVQRIISEHRLGREDAETVLVLADLVRKVRALHDAVLGEGGAIPPELVDALMASDATAEHTPSGEHRPTGGPTVRMALDRLAVPEVAEAAAVETLGLHTEGAATLELTAEILEPTVTRKARPAVRWLRAKAQERDGRVLEAERSLEAANSLDPQWEPVLIDLARFASDRGDVERGISLLQRARVAADDHLLVLLKNHRAPDRADVARNDPCWCGSGRRYKACHRGHEKLDLSARANWLYHKAWMHLSDGPARYLLLDVAQTWVGTDDPRRLFEALGEDRVIDFTLFEGGVFADFVATRGELLPDDERLLAEQWLLVERSVHEVESVRRDHGFTARDIRTGDRHEVRERLATHQLKVGDLLLMRLVPDGQDTVIFGGIESIDLARRDSLVALLDTEPDAVTLIEFIAAMHAPPTLRNADGGELIICEARLRLPDPKAVTAWLDGRLVRESDDPANTAWHEHVESAGGVSIRASATLEGDELELFAMSEDRFDAILDALVAARPEVVIIEETRRGADDLMESAAATPRASSMIDPRDADPQLAGALQDYIRHYELRWLDESIPALGGVTPRQAAADPTRRDDLVRLLDSFPAETGEPGQMSAARLRHDLDLI